MICACTYTYLYSMCIMYVCEHTFDFLLVISAIESLYCNKLRTYLWVMLDWGCACVCMRACVCVRACVGVCMCVCQSLLANEIASWHSPMPCIYLLHTHTHTHIHTHTHTRTHRHSSQTPQALSLRMTLPPTRPLPPAPPPFLWRDRRQPSHVTQEAERGAARTSQPTSHQE